MINRALLGMLHASGVLASLLSMMQPGHAGTVTGTGFAVTFDGAIVTNYHVISECSAPIKVRAEGSPAYYFLATVLARDAARDLAVLKLQSRSGQSSSRPIAVPRVVFRQGPPVQQGEKAITYGFPLRGLLATGGNLTVGYVSALSGLLDDSNHIQITTPIQPGNSGGPLYDGSGHVVGVVVAKLNALRVLRATGDVPQNVNFAVEAGAVRRFLLQSGVQVVEEVSAAEVPLPEIAQKAKRSTYLIECETQEFVVQVAAQRTEAEARSSFQGLQARYRDVLASHQANITRVDLKEKGGVFYRAQVEGFTTSDQAMAFCNRLKDAGGQCIVQRK